MRRAILISLAVLATAVVTSCSPNQTTGERLRTMRRGVWVSEGGAYTVWTGSHYFVVSASGDSASLNLYCGAAQVRYTDHGIAWKQNLRLRQLGPGNPKITLDYSMFQAGPDSTVEENPFELDESLFEPGKCVTHGGVIYDSIIEETDEYILLASCSGDREKIFNDGRSLYLPAGGGASWSYRIENL